MPAASRRFAPPARTSLRALFAFLVALSAPLAMVPPCAAGPSSTEPWHVERAGKKADLEAMRDDDVEYVSLEDVEDFFGMSEDQPGRREVVLSCPQGRITLHEGRAMVTVNDESVLLAAEVVTRKHRAWVPLDFLTTAVARLVGAQGRRDDSTRTIRFDAPGQVVRCESFADRTRVTFRLLKAPDLTEVTRDGRRRVVTLTNQELPAQTGGCLFDDVLQDLEIRPGGGQTRLTLFVGPRFSSLKMYELPDSQELVFDLLNDSTSAQLAPATSPDSSPRDIFDTVVLDAGHGGADQGAVGPTGLVEKDLTLAVTTALAKLLHDKGGLDVILTRSGDQFVDLTERTVMANRARADLFLSIHANANPASVAAGAETYVLDAAATDAGSRTLAAQENDATGLRSTGQGGGDLEMVLWDMAQEQYLADSERLADDVQRELNALAGTQDRGVKQANFAVLRGATMPAALVEIGFLTNPREEARMRTPEFQQSTAEALYRAVLAFRDQRQAAAARKP